MRPEVTTFLELGPLPSIAADPQENQRFEVALHAIVHPVSDQEAEALLGSFGEDDYFGLAWTLLHLIETSPTAFPLHVPAESDNMWLRHLYERKVR